MNADHEAGVEQGKTRLDETLLLERVSDLDRRTLVLTALIEPGRGQHAHAADAVAAGGRPEQHGQVAGAGGLGQNQALDRQNAQAQHVDQGVALVTLVEDDLAAHGGHSNRVPVAGDAGDDALSHPAAAGVIQRTKPEWVHQGNRPRPHGEDVSEDAASARGCALVRLNERRVIVALDTNGGSNAVAHVHDASVFAGANQDALTSCGQALEVNARGFVRAMLGPHHGVHRELQAVGLSTQDLHDVVQFGIGEPKGSVDRRGVCVGHGGEAT